MTIQTTNFCLPLGSGCGLCGLALPRWPKQQAGGGRRRWWRWGRRGRRAAGRGRTGTSQHSTTVPIDRPGNGQVGSANFYVDKDTGQVFVIADEDTTAYVSQVVSNLAKPKPQVLIKVVFLEVDYNKGGTSASKAP
jgi:hypothetical protein